jgi:hypothetical protein
MDIVVVVVLMVLELAPESHLNHINLSNVCGNGPRLIDNID